MEFLKTFSDYFESPHDKWIKNWTEVKAYMAVHHKRPTQTSKLLEEQKLGNWIITQQNNYKTCNASMADPDKRAKWLELITEYPQLFSMPETEDEPLEKIEETSAQQPKRSTTLYRTKRTTSDETPDESPSQKRQRTHSALSALHQKLIPMKSTTLVAHFRDHPTAFADYHRVREENFTHYREEDLPYRRIIAEMELIQTRRSKRVLDLGCGLGHIARYFHDKQDSRFDITSYDMVSTNELVSVCDINALPHEDHSMDIAILSFALWGPDKEKTLQEAKRVLESSGTLFLIDSTKRWSPEEDADHSCQEDDRDKNDAIVLKSMLQSVGFQIVREKIDKYCLFVCITL
jgi:hypothetical protein